MPQTVADIMTSDVATIESGESAAEAARRMAAADAGTVIVLDDGKVCGILTDRDIAVRLVAEGRGSDTRVAEIVSDSGLLAVTPDTSVDEAISLMRRKAVRRILVVQQDRAVGVVSLGDLAIERDPDSALADISVAHGNS